MKKFLQLISNLFVFMFRRKVEKVTVLQVSTFRDPVMTTKSVVQIGARKRHRLSAIIETAVLPEVRAEIVGKHHVLCLSGNAEGHFKVLGQIGTNGFARIRRFGDGTANQQMVRLSIG